MNKETITVRGQQYTVGDARALARELSDACASVTAGHPGMLEDLALVAREQLDVELWEVASVAGVDLDGISAAGVTELAMTMSDWEQRLAQHLLQTMQSA